MKEAYRCVEVTIGWLRLTNNFVQQVNKSVEPHYPRDELKQRAYCTRNKSAFLQRSRNFLASLSVKIFSLVLGYDAGRTLLTLLSGSVLTMPFASPRSWRLLIFGRRNNQLIANDKLLRR